MNFTKSTLFKRILPAIIVFLVFYSTFTFLSNINKAQAAPALADTAVEALNSQIEQEKAKENNLKAAKKEKLLATIEEWQGVRYVLGGESKKGTDCSGFVYTLYQNIFDVKLNRTANSQYQNVTPIDKGELKVGDLVFFKRSSGPIFHVGIYVGDNTFAHAASGRTMKVTYSQLDEPYYANHFYSGGRVKKA